MKRVFKRWSCLGLTLLLCNFLTTQISFATSIDPYIWEQLVRDADFVGIVECEVAGGIVAKYKVVESWKGPEVGTELTLRVAVNYWEPQFPITLCGEKHLVTAFKTSAPSRVMSASGGGTVPLWWRRLPADYYLPLFQGRALLPLSAGQRPLSELGTEHTDLASFREAVKDFLSRSDQQEIRLLRRLAEKYLRRDSDEKLLGELWERNAEERRRSDPNWRGENPYQTASSTAARREFLEKMVGWSSPLQFITNLLAIAPIHPPEGRFLGWPILEQACSREMLGVLESDPYVERVPQDVLNAIRRRLTPSSPSNDSPEISRYRSPFQVLVEDDPGGAVNYFLNWTNQAKEWHEKNLPYEQASYFCWHCPTNRAAYLRQLLNAREPFVRVAAAVYLCFEDKELGLRKLKEFSAIDGDAGAWAALNLARRGDKDAMTRVFKILETEGEPNMVGVPHKNLQKRLLVLLSNSARESGLPPPPISREASYTSVRSCEVLKQWWNEHRDQVILTDPWLPLLEAQKVD